MDNERKGTLLAVLTALVSGVAIVANKFFVTGLDPTVFTATRALLIGLAFLLISSHRNEVSGKKPWKSLVTIGIIGGGIAFLLFFTGLKLTYAGRAAFLHKTLPLYVALFAFIFLRERITRRQLVWLGSMFLGACLIFSTSLSLNLASGDLLVVLATVLWALECVLAKDVLKKESNFLVSFGRMFFGSLFLFGLVVVTGRADALLALTATQWSYLFASTGILFLYVFFWYWSIRLINVSKASSLLLLAPVVSMGLGAVLLGERIFNLQLLGSALILLGAWKTGRIKSKFLEQ